jgi:hypothetical protein
LGNLAGLQYCVFSSQVKAKLSKLKVRTRLFVFQALLLEWLIRFNIFQHLRTCCCKLSHFKSPK